MNKFSGILLSTIFQGVAMSSIYGHSLPLEQSQSEKSPTYLYKIVSLENWEKSQSENLLELSKDDERFIHLSTEDQLERIIGKYWREVPRYVILKVSVDKLPGRLVYEANLGGTTRYYHLYEGSIPLNSILEVQIIDSKK